MITSNVIQRVFRFKYQENVGTCFIIDIDDNQYFVTARHVLQIKDEEGVVQSELSDGGTVDIFRQNNWASVPTINVRHSDVSDVSIFTIGQKIASHPLPATTASIVYGQDLYFLGFPYGMSSDVGELNRNFPVPFVKKGILSTLPLNESGRPFLIDGHNNPGFSGGPVVFKESNSNDFKVAGLIHGYKPEFKSENGNTIPVENTNSGIIIAYSIDNAIDLINDITS